MKAVRFHGKNDLRYEDIPVPELGKGQVKIRPSWVGICGSDLHECTYAQVASQCLVVKS